MSSSSSSSSSSGSASTPKDVKLYNSPTPFSLARASLFRHVFRGKNVALLGPGGCGKTHLLREMVDTLRDRDYAVAVTSSTGSAADNLGCEATTLHSWLGLGLFEKNETGITALAKRIMRNPALVKRVAEARVLVIEEIGMIAPWTFSKLSAILREVKKCDKPFGGIQVVLAGDFAQIKPVVAEIDVQYIPADRRDFSFLFETPEWNALDLEVIVMESSYRHKDDPAFHDLLKLVRFSNVTPGAAAHLSSRVVPTEEVGHTTHITATNKAKDLVNARAQEKMDSPCVVDYVKFTAAKNLKFDNQKTTSAKNVEAMTRSVPEVLSLSFGTRVVINKNQDELFRGRCGRVVGFLPSWSKGIPCEYNVFATAEYCEAYLKHERNTVVNLGRRKSYDPPEKPKTKRRRPHSSDDEDDDRDGEEEDDEKDGEKRVDRKKHQTDGETYDGTSLLLPLVEMDDGTRWLIRPNEWIAPNDEVSRMVRAHKKSEGAYGAGKHVDFSSDGFVMTPSHVDFAGAWAVQLPLEIAFSSTIHRCVTGETLIPVDGRGLVRIRDLYLYGLWKDTKISCGKTFPGTCQQVMRVPSRRIVELTTETGRLLRTTAEHPILVHVCGECEHTESAKESICACIRSCFRSSRPDIAADILLPSAWDPDLKAGDSPLKWKRAADVRVYSDMAVVNFGGRAAQVCTEDERCHGMEIVWSFLEGYVLGCSLDGITLEMDDHLKSVMESTTDPLGSRCAWEIVIREATSGRSSTIDDLHILLDIAEFLLADSSQDRADKLAVFVRHSFIALNHLPRRDSLHRTDGSRARIMIVHLMRKFFPDIFCAFEFSGSHLSPFVSTACPCIQEHYIRGIGLAHVAWRTTVADHISRYNAQFCVRVSTHFAQDALALIANLGILDCQVIELHDEGSSFADLQLWREDGLFLPDVPRAQHPINVVERIVSSVDTVDVEDCYDLFVPDTGAFLSNNFISHNSQGLTLDKGHIDLETTKYVHGLTYTALSRFRSLSDFTLSKFDDNSVYCDPKVRDFYSRYSVVDRQEGAMSENDVMAILKQSRKETRDKKAKHTHSNTTTTSTTTSTTSTSTTSTTTTSTTHIKPATGK